LHPELITDIFGTGNSCYLSDTHRLIMAHSHPRFNSRDQAV